MNNIIFTGYNIRQSNTDLLKPISLSSLCSMIADESTDMATDCKRLRNVRRIDVQAYHKAKVCLPYFTIAHFKNNLRHSQNFIEARYIIIDIDNCADSIKQCNELKEQLARNNPEILLAFVSPSGTGIKLLFTITKPIQNTKYYTDFYRHFVKEFCHKNNIEQYADYKNCDVTRVCFMAHDKDVFFNAQAKTVDVPETLLAEMALPENNHMPDTKPAQAKPAIEENIYRQILATLNPGKATTKPPKQYFVPDILKHTEPIVAQAIEPYKFAIKQILPIQYGLQFVISHQMHLAVINIFYGKKGFSVVAVPRSDTHKPLSEIVHKIIANQLFSIEQAVNQMIYESLP